MRKLALLLTLTCLVSAQTARKIDTAKSKITVYAYKSGLFSFAAHDHVIAVPIAKGILDEQARVIEFSVNPADMQVLDPGESEKNRAEIRKTMLGEKLLEADRFPAIGFRSTSVKQIDSSTAAVEGVLTLHGQSRPISLTVKRNGARYAGASKLKQTDYGLTPVSVAGGTVKVKDEIKVEFEMVAQ